jgi:hypothetical protein
MKKGAICLIKMKRSRIRKGLIHLKKIKEKVQEEYRRKQALKKHKPKLKPLVIEKRNI